LGSDKRTKNPPPSRLSTVINLSTPTRRRDIDHGEPVPRGPEGKDVRRGTTEKGGGKKGKRLSGIPKI